MLEDKLTEKAAGSLDRLFASVPTTATAVALDPASGAPLTASAQRVQARDVAPGQHVLVKPGEQVRLLVLAFLLSAVFAVAL